MLNHAPSIPLKSSRGLSTVQLLPECDETPLVTETPRQRPKPAPGLWEALFWAFIFFVVIQLPAAGLVIWSEVAAAGEEVMTRYFLYALLAGQILGVGLSVLVLRWRVGSDWRRAIHLRLPKPIPCLLAAVCLPVVSALAIAAMVLTVTVFDLQLPTSSLDGPGKQAFWLSFLVIAVGAPLNEELFCRGFLGRGLVGRYGVLVGVLLTSLIFAVIHANIFQGIVALVLGGYIHLAYLATRSLWVPALLHFLHNGTVTVIAYLFANAAGGAEQGAAADFDLPWYFVVGLIVGACVPVAISILSGCALYFLRDRQGNEEQTA
jgi:membrane protease YdiL (CAAX protease family)